MKFDMAVRPNQCTKQERILVRADGYLPYTGAFWGAYTYCAGLHIDNGIEFLGADVKFPYNLQIGRFNSIGINLQCVFGRNHNYRSVSTGAVELLFKDRNIQNEDGNALFNQKGSIVIQNDIWVGENVSLMPGIIIRNGAVIARNSHVVSDLPPFAIVGGNPARVIGYRYSKEQIDMLQTISWWDWDVEKIVDNAAYFTEDIDKFCETFYSSAKREFDEFISVRENGADTYFAFVDYYENYSSYSYILEDYLERFVNNDDKKLVLFVQDGVGEGTDFFEGLKRIAKDIEKDCKIKCSVEIRRGTLSDACDCFQQCSHYIMSRTYDTVYFTCLADRLGMEIISGVDSVIQFEKRCNMIRKN